MISVIEEYSNIIASYEVRKFRIYGEAHEFVAIVKFIDKTSLFIRDYVFLNGKRKYSFHWQDNNSTLITRWDNSEHYHHLKTFPFHKHIENTVEESQPMTLKKVLEFILKEISRK